MIPDGWVLPLIAGRFAAIVIRDRRALDDLWTIRIREC